MANFIKPKVYTIDEYNEIKKLFDPIKALTETRKVEIAGRTCYNSYHKINQKSDEAIIKSWIKSGHESVIEFSSAIFETSQEIFNLIKLSTNSEFFNYTKDKRYLISGNIRSWRNFILYSDCDLIVKEYIKYKFKKDLYLSFFLFDIPYDSAIPLSREILFKKINESDLETDEEKLNHIYYHFVIETDRAVMAELTRHRKCSFAIISQRYVNYKTGVDFVIPYWCNDKGFKKSIQRFLWKRYCKLCESGYKWMIRFGSKPQEARGILPNAVKTIINITANKKEFEHIFKLRCSKAAHPDIQLIAEIMKIKIAVKDLSE